MKPFSPTDIRNLASGTSDRKHEVLKIANLISSHRVDGGSTRLRRFLANVRASGSSPESLSYAAYLSNEINYLLTHYGNILTLGPVPINHDRIDRAVNTARDWFDRARGVTNEASVSTVVSKGTSTPALINNHSSNNDSHLQQPSVSGLLNDQNSTQAWINNTLYFCKQFSNARMQAINADTMLNLFKAEASADRIRINPRVVNDQGYMGAFQMGPAEWNSNRRHGLKGAPDGCPSSVADSYTRSGKATGPADVIVAPAVWARYISKSIGSIPQEIVSRSFADAIYVIHNIGLGNLNNLIAFAKGAALDRRCGWAMFTQLGLKKPCGKGCYTNSLSKARRRHPSESRSLRAFMNVVNTYRPNYRHEDLIEQAISASQRSSNFAARTVA